MENLKETPRVYTKLKFIKSSKTDAVISFVSQNPQTGRICGVREDSKYPKKICVVDKSLSNDILLNVLYDCTLIPMAESNGYVVIAAEPCQFKARIETTYVPKAIYVVEVKFGNKTIRFDPKDGRKESIRSLQACKDVLAKRVDVKDICEVLESFESTAKKILNLMETDRYDKRRRK